LNLENLMASATLAPLKITVADAAGTALFTDKELAVTDFRGSEAISQLFSFELGLTALGRTQLPFEKVLGQQVTVVLERENNKKRFFRGVCNTLSEGPRDRSGTLYRATIVPLFWLLTRSVQSRIFDHKTVPEILETVLNDVPGLDFVLQLSAQYPPHDYCTQYRESDFNFACRLMEEEGIYYFFDHSEAGTLMVLADAPGKAHRDIETEVRFGPGRSISFVTEVNRLFEWEKGQQLRSGRFTVRDHHFELNAPGITESPQPTRPPAVNAGTVAHPLNLLGNDHEIVDYPGESAHRFDDVDLSGGASPRGVDRIADDNARTAKIRIEQETVSGLLIRGTGSCAAFAAGSTFKVIDHFNANGEYLLVSVTHAVSQQGTFAGNGNGSGLTYQNGFTCIPFTPALPFRPPRSASKPFIPGTQTATVVGLEKDGEAKQEIFTDKFGRVKVQFHWDRENRRDPRSSCWVRVGTFWAGTGWGAMHIPRVGHEVIVAFLEGNPDQPIIVGSVYNARHMPHYELPKFKTLSYVKSDTTPGSKGFNELRFEDKKGKEQVFVHSQNRMDVRVRGSLFETCGGNREESIGAGGGDQPGGNLTVTVGGAHDLHVQDEALIGIDKKLNVGVKADVVEDFQTTLTTLVKAKAELNAKEITLEAKMKLTLMVGSSFIVIDPSGVTIQGPIVRINCGGAAVGTGQPVIDDPLDAAGADTGEPGFLDRPQRGGARVRRRRTLNSQHGLAVARNADGSFQVGKNLSVDGSKPDLAAKTLNALAVLDDTPTGKKVLDQLNAGRHPVKIIPDPKVGSGGGETLAGGVGAIHPEEGAGSTIRFDPDRKPTGTDQAGNTHDGPPEATLGHELIHALHNSDGRNLTLHRDEKDPDGNQEESRTIGINDHKDEELSENNILKDLGAPYRRLNHGTNPPNVVPVPVPALSPGQ
jgi:type VI secretion system secreted protein VgrG